MILIESKNIWISEQIQDDNAEDEEEGIWMRVFLTKKYIVYSETNTENTDKNENTVNFR